MTARRGVSNLNAEDLGFSGEVDVSHIDLYDHLTTRLQELLTESKKFKNASNYKNIGNKFGEERIRLLAEGGHLNHCKPE